VETWIALYWIDAESQWIGDATADNILLWRITFLGSEYRRLVASDHETD
jgi:hypothetical protein